MVFTNSTMMHNNLKEIEADETAIRKAEDNEPDEDDGEGEEVDEKDEDAIAPTATALVTSLATWALPTLYS